MELSPLDAAQLGLVMDRGISLVRAFRLPAGRSVQMLSFDEWSGSVSWLQGPNLDPGAKTFAKDPTFMRAELTSGPAHGVTSSELPDELAPLGRGIAWLTTVDEKSSSCGATKCYRIEARWAETYGAPERVVATSSSVADPWSGMTNFAGGVAFEIQQGKMSVDYVWRPPTPPVAVRRGDAPAVGLTVVGDQLVGQVVGSSGFWSVGLDGRPPRAPLPESARRYGTGPSGSGNRLNWQQVGVEGAEFDAAPLMVSTLTPNGTFSPARMVVGEKDTYNAVWADACHLVTRTPTGLFDTDTCHGWKRRTILDDHHADEMYNSARFDAGNGKVVFALDDGTGALAVVVMKL